MEVMERYRELGSTLEASIQVRKEGEEEAGRHWHRMGERCWCEHLSIPSRFFHGDVTQKKAEERYLEWLAWTPRPLHGLDEDAAPLYVNPPVMGELQTDSANLQTSTPDTDAANTSANMAVANKDEVCGCGKPARPRGKNCWGCYRRERR